MTKDPVVITNEILRLVGEVIADKPQIAKAFAERLTGLVTKPEINVFDIYGADGEAATRKALAKLSNGQLFAIIYHFDFDSASIPAKPARKPALIDHIAAHLKAQFNEQRLLSRG
jgi:hypothetical protein